MSDPEPAQPAQAKPFWLTALQQTQLGQVEQTVRGVGEDVGEAPPRQLREDAPGAENLERPSSAKDGSPEHWPD